MQFTELLNKLKIKVFAPATIVYRQLGYIRTEFLYCSWLPARMIFKGEPIDKKTGYYKTVYINDKRVKPNTIIPRHALIEVRQRPNEPVTLLGSIVAMTFASFATVTAMSTAAFLVIGIATIALAGAALVGIGFGISALTGKKKAGSGGGTETPTYSANENPSLSGGKNEILEKHVPIVIGRTFQTFTYAQYAIPFVKSGYSSNRYKMYFIPTYKNVNFYDFKLGDTLLNNYKSSAYNISEAHGTSNFIGWDNAQTEGFNNKELSFDSSQAVFLSAIAYYNQTVSGSSLTINQTYHFNNVNYDNFSNKKFDVEAIFISGDTQVSLTNQITVTKSDITLVEGTTNEYTCNKTISFNLGAYTISEYLRTSTQPNGATRNNSYENDLTCELEAENIVINSTTYNPVDFGKQSVDSYSGDRVEVLSQSPTDSKYCDIHFVFPSGLYKINSSNASRMSTTIQAEVKWKRVGDTSWNNLSHNDIAQLYVRNIEGEIQPAQSATKISNRITRAGNIITFKSPDDINNANTKFYECLGIEFAESGQYIINMQPVVFNKDNYFTGSVCVSEVVWRFDPTINVVNPSMLPSVSQVACTFNATTQLEGDVDEVGAISFAKVKNLSTGLIEESRNPVDIIYYLLTDSDSNPNPMSENQIDMPSFLKARQWCEAHECKTDGIINEEVKYSAVIEEITNNNQLYLIPNKNGKVVLRVDTNEDNRPIKTLFNAENSWDLVVKRIRGRLRRTLAIRCSYIDEETWSNQEITGYWYNNQCNWQPEEGKDDLYYQPEKRDLKYIRNADSVKRRIAYELEVANTKNTIAEFNIAREVLDLEVLDRVLVADYTRINDGVCGSIDEVISKDGFVVGVKTSQAFVVKPNMTICIRSVDTTGEGDNVKIYNIKENEKSSTTILFKTPIPMNESNIRTSGFYTVDGQEFYYSGDLYNAGTAEIMSMVVKSIEEVSGDNFTSKITCRTY